MAMPPERVRLLYLLQLQLAEVQGRQAVILAALIRVLRERQNVRRRRRWWVRPWIQRRTLLGQYDTLIVELARECGGDYVNFFRMTPEMFREILHRVTPHIERNRRHRTPIEPGLKLAITLRYLASGDSYRSIAYNFRVPHNTISLFVPEVCEAIIDEYQQDVFNFPQTADGWREVAEEFGRRWNFHHACGAIDGKHIRIRCPPGSGSVFYNYKGYFSLVLLGVVDASYKFLWADVGAPGSSSDCQIFNNGPLRPALEDEEIQFPPPEPLPHDDRDVPYFFLGDDAFPLRKWMMKPYSRRHMTDEERIFNYRLSRGRRVVENAFGIMANRWRCLLTTMHQKPKVVQRIVSAAMCLHNLMRERYPGLQNRELDVEGPDGEVVPGAWRQAGMLDEMQNVQGGNVANTEGKQLRVYLKEYCNSHVGSLPWQHHMI